MPYGECVWVIGREGAVKRPVHEFPVQSQPGYPGWLPVSIRDDEAVRGWARVVEGGLQPLVGLPASTDILWMTLITVPA